MKFTFLEAVHVAVTVQAVVDAAAPVRDHVIGLGDARAPENADHDHVTESDVPGIAPEVARKNRNRRNRADNRKSFFTVLHTFQLGADIEIFDDLKFSTILTHRRMKTFD